MKRLLLAAVLVLGFSSCFYRVRDPYSGYGGSGYGYGGSGYGYDRHAEHERREHQMREHQRHEARERARAYQQGRGGDWDHDGD